MSTVEHGATIRGAATAKAELVDRFEDLGFEIDTAMASIAGDQLHAFEASVRRQEIACNRLSALVGELAPGGPGASVAGPGSGSGSGPGSGSGLDLEEDRALNLRLRTATATIKTLNAQYSTLLRHSGQSLRLLASLSSSSTGYAGRSQSPANQRKQQTWSCEV